MRFLYPELINRFHDVLGTPKTLIEETFNKPDKTEVVKNAYVSIKKFDNSYILIIFEDSGNAVKFLNAYKIYPELLDGLNINAVKPLDVLREFMNRYGIKKSIPGFGEHNFFVEKNVNVFFLGILDIEKYLEAVKNIQSSNPL